MENLIDDTELGKFANIMGLAMVVLLFGYHYLTA